MPQPAAIIAIPTRDRPGQLATALDSLVPQAAARGIDVLVVDDGPTAATREIALRHGARYRAVPRPGGLNAARNAAMAETTAPLVLLLDDNIVAWPGWLDAMLHAHATQPDDVAVLAGQIVPWLDPQHAPRSCGRHGSPVTELMLGDDDGDTRYGWGANLGVRREWWLKAGPFDEAIGGGGDEEEWIDRATAAGARVRYIAAAGVRHDRTGHDAALRPLMRSARARGRNMRRYETGQGRAPSLLTELKVLLGCIAHVVLRRCPMGLTLVAHSFGRIEQTITPHPAPARAGLTDFVSGRSGHVAGKRARLLAMTDRLLNAVRSPLTLIEQVRSRRLPRRRVLALAIVRDEQRFAPIAARLTAGRHSVTIDAQPLDDRPKYARISEMLSGHDLGAYDHVLLVDDDIELPRGFTDRFLWTVERTGLLLAQPAHRRHSHAAWPVTRRRLPFAARRTHFVEIGPLTLLRGEALQTLVPFPQDAGMGWGLDNHWGAIARDRGWPIGVVDTTPMLHVNPVAAGYGRDETMTQMRRFLAGRAYVTRDEAAWSQRAERR